MQQAEELVAGEAGEYLVDRGVAQALDQDLAQHIALIFS
jgi:hypothetical protein